jgi:hypothetical protein
MRLILIVHLWSSFVVQMTTIAARTATTRDNTQMHNQYRGQT